VEAIVEELLIVEYCIGCMVTTITDREEKSQIVVKIASLGV
jgi:hypothetical protein